MSKKRKWLGNLLYVLLIFTGASLVANTWITRDHVAGAAPGLATDNLIHARSPQIPFDASRPTLVYFYASWCGICKVDMPAVESVAGHYPVIAIAMQSGDDKSVLEHRADNDINLDILNDPDGDLARQFRVRAVPTAYVVREGEIKFSTQGFSGWIGYWTRMLLASLV